MARILVVDDEAIVRTVVRRKLEPEGHEVVEAETPDGATAVVSRNRPDLILLDIYLDRVGKGVTGIDFCRKLQEDPVLRAIPVIMLTAHGDHDHVVQATNAGATDFIVKPFQTGVLVEKVKKALTSTSPAEKPEREAEPPRRERRRGSGLADQWARQEPRDTAGESG